MQTIWAKDPFRCVLVEQLRPTVYTVYLFDGARRISSDVVDHPTHALDVAALLRALFIDRPA